jgi:hypothetical protein
MRSWLPYHMFPLTPKAARLTAVRHEPILYLDPCRRREHMQKEEEEEQQLTLSLEHMRRCAQRTPSPYASSCAPDTACLFAFLRFCEPSFCLLMFHHS